MKKLILISALAFLAACSTYTPPVVKQTAEQMEKEEFDMLIKQDSIDKNKNAAESLDILLNESTKDKRISLVINNNSNCNIILRFAGEKFYNLPIRKNNMNFIVIEKGSYSLGANLCNSRYSATKEFTDSVNMTLSEAK